MRLGLAVLASVLLLVDGTAASAKKKEAADVDSYLSCLQQGMAAAPQGDPATVRTKVLSGCLLIRRGVATVTMALLILQGETEKRAGAETDAMMAADDEKAQGISRQDDAALFAAYGMLEKQLVAARADYQFHEDGRVDCIVTQSSGDPGVDAARCAMPQACPPLDARPGTRNSAAFACLATEQRKQLLLLAINRTGLASLSAPVVGGAPGQ
jgi:hypothetical protein